MPAGAEQDAVMKGLRQEGFAPERITIGRLRDNSALNRTMRRKRQTPHSDFS